jgi:hypothetical protein
MCDSGQTCVIDPIAGAASAAGHAVTDAAGHAVTGVASDTVGAIAGDWLQAQLSSFITWCGKAVIWATSWWADGTTMDPNVAPVIQLQHQLVPIAVLILTLGVMWQAGKMILSRKPAPLVDVTAGLVRYVAVSVAGLAFWETVIQLCDYATHAILHSSAQDFGTALGQRLMLLVAPTVTGGPAMPVLALVVIGLVLMIASCIQWLLAWIRLAGIQILAVLLPLAAAGSITESTRPWLRKVNAWMLALVTYKLIAAIIYRIGVTFLTVPLTGVAPDMEPVSRTMIGLMVLLLAIFTLPVMMKFFAFLGTDGSGGGVLGAVLGAGALAAGSVKVAGMMRGGASNSAAQMAANGPGSGPSGGPSGGSPGGPTGRPTGGQSGGRSGSRPGAPSGPPPGPGGTPGPSPRGAPPTSAPGSRSGGPGPGAAPSSGGNQSTPAGNPAPGAAPAPGATPATTSAAAPAGAGAGAGTAAAGAGATGAATATAGPAGVALRHVNNQAHGVGGQPPETS